jgi:hypothetical protein
LKGKKMPALEIGRVIDRKIVIEPSANKGFIVRSGCGTFVAKNIDELLSGLGEYLRNPDVYEKKYNELSHVTMNEAITYGRDEPDVPDAPRLAGFASGCEQCQEEAPAPGRRA